MEFLQFIPIPLLLVVTIAANLGSGVINRHYSKNVTGGLGGFYFFLVITSAVSVLSIAAISGFDLAVSGYTAAIGAAFGVVMTVSAVFLLYSIKIGPWSYTTVITSFSMLIPAIGGAICWHEEIDALTIVGMVLVVASVVLSVQTKKKSTAVAPSAIEKAAITDTAEGESAATADSEIFESEMPAVSENTDKNGGKTKFSARWIVCVSIAALASGGIGMLQMTHQKSVYRGELLTMLVIAFAVETVILSIALLAYVLKYGRAALFENPPKTKKLWALLVFLIVVAGLCGMLNHVINLYLSGVMDSAVFFPLVNGSNLVLVTVLSIFVYRERLSVKQWIGLGIGIIAVLCLCL